MLRRPMGAAATVLRDVMGATSHVRGGLGSQGGKDEGGSVEKSEEVESR